VPESEFTPEQCRQILYRVARLRIPNVRQELTPEERGQVFGDEPLPPGPAGKIIRLEGFMVDSAIARGDAEEAALYMQAAVKRLEDEWDAIEGWETLLPATASERTEKAVVRAKRQLKPELYDGIREGKWLADKLKTQARRLERDEEACSRLYTMATGG
jgi:hypothetical protein